MSSVVAKRPHHICSDLLQASSLLAAETPAPESAPVAAASASDPTVTVPAQLLFQPGPPPPPGAMPDSNPFTLVSNVWQNHSWPRVC